MLGGMLVRRVLLQKSLKTTLLKGRLAVIAARPWFSTSTNRLADLTVELKRGHPVIAIPLPTSGELCEFTLQNTHSVRSFVDSIKEEDGGVEDAVVHSLDGNRVAQTTILSTLLTEGFDLKINDETFTIQPTSQVSEVVNDNSLENVRGLVEKLYINLNASEEKIARERQLTNELENIHTELEPLESTRQDIEKGVETKTNALVWGGLAFMAVQFGFLARLTWWEYSWDIMEPVTYFVTYGTSMACYAYFVLTRQEYMYPEARNRQFLISFHKKAKHRGFDVEKYNNLRDAIAKIEEQMEELDKSAKSTTE